MEEKFSFLLFIISILDLYFNYYEKDIPPYHKSRILSDIFTITSILTPFILVIFLFITGCLLYCQLINNVHMHSCTVCFTIISSLLVISLSFGSFIFQIYSIYLYLVNDGHNKIKSRMVKFLMPLCLISIFIKIFFAICNLISSVKNKNKSDSSENNEDLTNTELIDQSEV